MQRREPDRTAGITRPDPFGLILLRWAPPLLFGMALLSAGFAYFAFDSLWPRGVKVEDDRSFTGFLAVDPSDARTSRFIDRRGLEQDYRAWIRQDKRTDSSRCLLLPDALAERLAAMAKPRPAAEGGYAYFMGTLKVEERVVKGGCDGGKWKLAQMPVVTEIVEAQPIPCSRDVFAAHGMACPAERHSPQFVSEVFGGQNDYYPMRALREEMQGTVQVRVSLDRTGSPIRCDVLQSSGHPFLDRHTCKLIGTDPAFTRSAGPDRLDGTIVQRVRWQIPDI